MKKFIVLLIFCLSFLASISWATDYYVRTNGGGPYGGADGTSYTDAWEGFGNIVWGAGGVIAGDTLYVCGTNREDLIVGVSGADGSLVTISGACPGDPGIILGSDNYGAATWTEEGGAGTHIWYTTDASIDDCKFALFGSELPENVGTRKANKVDLAAVRDFWWDDGVADRFYVYSTDASGPNVDFGANIELPQRTRRASVKIDTKSYVEVKNITSKYNALTGIRVVDSSYIYIHDNTISYGGGYYTGVGFAGNGMQIDGDSDHIYSYNNDTSYLWDACLSFHTFDGSTLEYVYVYDNTADYCGVGINASAITVAGGVIQHVWLHDNVITNQGYGWQGMTDNHGGKGINSRADDDCSGNDINIYNNTIDKWARLGINLQGLGAGTNNIYNNILTNGTIDYAAGTMGTIVIDGLGDVDHYTNANVYYNLAYGNARYGAATINNSRSVYIYNNTFVNNGTSQVRVLGSVNEIVKNNILVATTGQYCYYKAGGGDIGTLDYNLYYKDGTGWFRDPADVEYDTVAAWYAATGKDEHSKGGDPLFLDAANGVFRLSPGSPAIDAGTDVGLTSDINGLHVPIGAYPDIGAYEFAPAIPEYYRRNRGRRFR